MSEDRAVSVREMQALDRIAQEHYGIPSAVLMERAASAVYVLVSQCAEQHVGRICICAGHGNNGGDGMAVARLLDVDGRDVEVWLVNEPNRLQGDAALQWAILQRMGVCCRVMPDTQSVCAAAEDLASAGLVVDALLGIGVSGDVREPIRSCIELINHREVPVISIDVPSGMDADTGEPFGVCVQATWTVTFGAMKTGLVSDQGARFAGQILVDTISIPREAFQLL